MAPTRLRAQFIASTGAAGDGSGGAVYSDGGTVTLSSDNVSSNTAQGGQGGSLKSGSSTAGASSTSGGSGNAGGLCAQGGTVSVNSSTLSGNIAQGGGGGAGLNGAGGAVGGTAYGGAIVIQASRGRPVWRYPVLQYCSGRQRWSRQRQRWQRTRRRNLPVQPNPKLVSVLTNTTLSSNTAQGGSGQGGDEAALNGNGLGGAIYVGYGSIELDMGAVSSNVAQGGTANDYQDLVRCG